jgi:hypothetical protein
LNHNCRLYIIVETINKTHIIIKRVRISLISSKLIS